MLPPQGGCPYPQFAPQQPILIDPRQAEMEKLQLEKAKNKEFKEIYDYVKKREKSKYKAKIQELVKQVEEANKAVKEANTKPEQRTVKLQTRKSQSFINRGWDPIPPPNEEKEISAQPEFRQESIEKAVSEKLDEIQQKAKEHLSKKKPFRKIYYRPNGNFAKHVS